MKFKSIIGFLVIVISFLLVGCQTESKVPVKAEYEYKTIALTCTAYEYRENAITCYESLQVESYEDTPPSELPSFDSFLNLYGKDGWRVINIEIGAGYWHTRFITFER